VSKIRSSKQSFFSSLNLKCPKDFWKSIKAINPSSRVYTISSLFDSSTNTEAKDNSSKAELLNHTFVSHFNTKQMPIQHSDIPEVNPDVKTPTTAFNALKKRSIISFAHLTPLNYYYYYYYYYCELYNQY